MRITLAHINDQHSQLDAFANTELRLDGVPTQIDMGGFARVTAAFRAYDGRKDVIKLHAGDAITMGRRCEGCVTTRHNGP